MVFSSFFGLKEMEDLGNRRDVRETAQVGSEGPGSKHLKRLSDEEDEQGSTAPSHLRASEAEFRVLQNVSSCRSQVTDNEDWTIVAGFSAGIGSLYLQEVLTYPLLAIRRQCQVNHSARNYHLTPFALFQLLLKIQKNQGIGALWKGWGTTCVVQGFVILTEIGISETARLPRDLSKKEHISLKHVIGHQIMKCLGIVMTLPFYSASLVDSVQSYQLGAARSFLDFLKDVFYRLAGWYQARGHGRLLPMYFLLVPTLLHGMLHYVIAATIEKAVTRTLPVSENPDEQIVVHPGKTYYHQLLAGLISSVVTDLILYPLETVVIRLHVQGTRTIIDDTDTGDGVVPLCTNYDGLSDCARTICREEGASALYKGLGALFLQFFVQACILKITKSVLKRLSPDSDKPPKKG